MSAKGDQNTLVGLTVRDERGIHLEVTIGVKLPVKEVKSICYQEVNKLARMLIEREAAIKAGGRS